MRGRMGLKVSGLDYEHREIILRDKPQEMLDASPKGTVPVKTMEKLLKRASTYLTGRCLRTTLYGG